MHRRRRSRGNPMTMLPAFALLQKRISSVITRGNHRKYCSHHSRTRKTCIQRIQFYVRQLVAFCSVQCRSRFIPRRWIDRWINMRARAARLTICQFAELRALSLPSNLCRSLNTFSRIRLSDVFLSLQLGLVHIKW